ncbi:hypothetical protein QBC33DRAFT_544364 [Phialemonium atrogriseum]|uniref:Uncharacterized protein n=1 Tax=Phialemonium atrogriseum TaxID=1093897 RepID=A0AAJ0BX42_9PEZI|nr:uncharacterized protein QBC33DRAFT_544364 [Phialemonium atrogriseum]KAK1765467.1 hypothetical protein QBC33DRAFT_544364 [Phialemonium atrogriseum]
MVQLHGRAIFFLGLPFVLFWLLLSLMTDDRAISSPFFLFFFFFPFPVPFFWWRGRPAVDGRAGYHMMPKTRREA